MITKKKLNKTITTEISSVTIPVAHFRPLNVVTHETISFRVFREDDWFKAVPQVSAEERLTTGIPEELIFAYLAQVVLDANNMEEETLDVIKHIIQELEVLDLV